MNQHELRHELGYVPQKAFLFSGTIESTIAYSNQDMDTSRVRQAADIAQATEFIDSKENGFSSLYETRLCAIIKGSYTGGSANAILDASERILDQAEKAERK